jgi:hypothetical protein
LLSLSLSSLPPARALAVRVISPAARVAEKRRDGDAT